jgi:hypothetical protein
MTRMVVIAREAIAARSFRNMASLSARRDRLPDRDRVATSTGTASHGQRGGLEPTPIQEGVP